MTKVLVTGGTGMLGRSLVKKLNETNLPVLTPNRSELDLSDFNSVKNYFEYFKPSIVFHCAASVGGIQANVNSKSLFLTENYVIDFNVLTSAREQRVSRLAYVGSSCMYPAGLDFPMREELLLTGSLEKTNESYALSKIVGTKYVEAVREQDSLNWHTFIASNLYGPGDNFDPQTSHLLASIIRKVADCKKTKLNEIEIWGTGRARREFTYVEDFAEYLDTHKRTTLFLGYVRDELTENDLISQYNIDSTDIENSDVYFLEISELYNNGPLMRMVGHNKFGKMI
jgi:GDP-L-fucose synthase